MNPIEDKDIREQIAKGQIPTRKLDANIPTEEIELPSQGKLYPEGHPLSSGKILLKYPTAKEEDILTSKNLLQKGTAIDAFIRSIIADKTINMDDILLGDKNAIIIASRIMAYGKEYQAEVNCPACTARNVVNIDISDFQPKEVDGFEKMSENNFEFTLPASKAVVRYKILTDRDLKEIDSILKSNKKSLKIQTSPEMTTRLRVSILSVNGSEDRMEIKSFVDSMLAIDSKALRDEINRITPDIDLRFLFQCEECGQEEMMTMPLGINFFWPSNQ